MNGLMFLLMYLVVAIIFGAVFEEMEDRGVPTARGLMWIWPVVLVILTTCLIVSVIETVLESVENIRWYVRRNRVRRERAFEAFHEACRRGEITPHDD